MKRIVAITTILVILPTWSFAGGQPIVDLSTTTLAGVTTNLNQSNKDQSQLRALLIAINTVQQYIPLAASEVTALINEIQALGGQVQTDTNTLPGTATVQVGP